MKNYDIERYIFLEEDNKIVDTKVLLPHVECYYIQDNQLFFESITGECFSLGAVIRTTNVL